MYWIIAIAAAFLLLPALTGVRALRRARQSIGRLAPDTSAVDGEAADDSRRVYYFHSENCGHCRATTRRVAVLRMANRNLIKVSIEEFPELARAFGIAATPSFVLVKGGTISQIKLGAQREDQLLRLLWGKQP